MYRISGNPPSHRYAYPRAARPARPAARPSSALAAMLRMAVLALILGLPLLAIWGTTAFFMYYQAYGLVAPGVYARGVDLGGLSISQAAAKLDRAWNIDRKIELGHISADGVQSWLVSPPEIGLWVDVQATAQQAFAIGRHDGALSGLYEVLSGLWIQREVALAIRFDPRAARGPLIFVVAGEVGEVDHGSRHLEGEVRVRRTVLDERHLPDRRGLRARTVLHGQGHRVGAGSGSARAMAPGPAGAGLRQGGLARLLVRKARWEGIVQRQNRWDTPSFFLVAPVLEGILLDTWSPRDRNFP